MISLAHLIVQRYEAGKSVADEFAHLPPFQMRIWFEELQPICPSRRNPALERRPANALNIEIGQPLSRYQDPEQQALCRRNRRA